MVPPPPLLALRFGLLGAYNAIGRLYTCSTPRMMMTLVMLMKVPMMVSNETANKSSKTSITNGDGGGGER